MAQARDDLGRDPTAAGPAQPHRPGGVRHGGRHGGGPLSAGAGPADEEGGRAVGAGEPALADRAAPDRSADP